MPALVLPESLGAAASDLSAPLYVAWQLTNACDLACRHCIEDSGPGRAFGAELSLEEGLRVADQIIAAQVPYASFSGGEPLLHPHLFALLERFRGSGVGLKLETNGQRLDAAACRRLAEAGVASVQVSLDGPDEEVVRRLRPGARLDLVLEGVRRLREAGVAVEANFAPTRWSAGLVRPTMELAHGLGAGAFYTGRLMRAGRAASHWEEIRPTPEQYVRFFAEVAAGARAYAGRMRVCYHELGIVEELRYRLEHPAALFIVLPDGKVKLVNALPFVCGDLRRQSLAEVWSNYGRAWKNPR
ncbi:MAG: radical SAM protein, partial [Elusimicrobia bacterium]|nr:radical SAM protein [Elusimicrobiota bacterium]